MARNKGGRPPLEKDKRSFKIDVRFTETEYRQVEALEKSLGLSKTELVRRRLLMNDSEVLVNVAQALNQLDRLNLELARSGNNINQLARYANRLAKHGVLSPLVAKAIVQLLQDHGKQKIALQKSFRQLLRVIKRK